MRWFSEDEAKGKICPILMLRNGAGGASECIASRCMMWVILDNVAAAENLYGLQFLGKGECALKGGK